jgi:hypothetical protein
MQQSSSSCDRIIFWAICLHAAGGGDSLQALHESPSLEHCWLPQKVQNEVMQVRLLPGTQTSHRLGHSE